MPEAGWVGCWSAKILGWAVSDPFKSDLDVCAVQGIVLGTLCSRGVGLILVRVMWDFSKGR